MKNLVVTITKIAAWINMVVCFIGGVALAKEADYEPDRIRFGFLAAIVAILVFFLSYGFAYVVEAACTYLEKEEKRKAKLEAQEPHSQVQVK